MARFLSGKMKRKDVEEVYDGFSEFSLSSPAKKIRRLEFFNALMSVSAQATFPYKFAVSKFLQLGSFDLVGTIVYEVDQQQYQSVFYNGTIEVVEAGGFVRIESVFFLLLGLPSLPLSDYGLMV